MRYDPLCAGQKHGRLTGRCLRHAQFVCNLSCVKLQEGNQRFKALESSSGFDPAFARTEENMTQFSTPQIDFTNPALLKALHALPDFSKSSYLIGLAAWQRGLTVEYFGTQAAAGVRHIFMPPHADRPDLFRISDRSRSHFFNRTIGDATPIAAAALSADK